MYFQTWLSLTMHFNKYLYKKLVILTKIGHQTGMLLPHNANHHPRYYISSTSQVSLPLTYVARRYMAYRGRLLVRQALPTAKWTPLGLKVTWAE